MEYCWASLLRNNGLSSQLLAFTNDFMNQWYMELVMMFISQWNGITYLRLWLVVLMDITMSNDLVVLVIE